MEVYESHLGGVYFTEELLDFDDLYCDQCGDSDTHAGYAETWEEVLDLLTDEDGWCRYNAEYLSELEGEWKSLME